MGGISKGLGGPTPSAGDAALALGAANLAIEANLIARVERLTKLVHILWKEAERLESLVKVIPEGLQIKTGFSEVTVLRNGGIVIKGLRVLVETPGKSEFYF